MVLLNWANSAGLIQGYENNNLNPQGKAARAAAARPRPEDKPQSDGAYGVNQTKTAASNTYAMGRKLAQKQKNSKKIQQSKNSLKAEQFNENVPKTQNYGKP